MESAVAGGGAESRSAMWGRLPAGVLWATAGALLLFVAAFALYWPVLTDFFALDDFIWLQAASHPNVAGVFKDAFSFPHGTPFDRPTPFWRPLVDLYFAAAWRVFGLEPLPYHVMNVMLHGGVACLLAVLVGQLGVSRPAALAAGLLFVVLPTYGFAVSWISSVTELMGAFLYLLTLVLYAAYLKGQGRSRVMYMGALAALFLALLSKESAVTLPVALVLLVGALDLPRSTEVATRRLRELAPFVALTAAYFVFLYIQEYRAGADEGSYRFGWHFADNLWAYLKWMTLPLPDDWASWVKGSRPATATLFLAAGTSAALLGNARLGFAFVWTLVALLPYAFFPAGIEFRYTYLASIPFVIFFAVLLDEAIRWLTPRLALYPTLALGAAVVVSLVVFLAMEARDRQTPVSDQADAYHQLFDQAFALCGDLPPRSHIFIVSSPTADLFGGSARMAMNMRYEDVSVGRGLPELAAFIENKCVIQYVGDRCVRVD